MSHVQYQYELEDLPQFVAEVLRLASAESKEAAVLIALQGDLGAGKTTFVQELARQLGVVETVTSPTFTIMRQYETTHPDFSELIHMDAYRIEDVGELGPLRLATLFSQSRTLMCIEWPEHIATALPSMYILISITIDEVNRRIAQVTRKEV